MVRALPGAEHNDAARKGGRTVNLFAYGTLMDPRIIARVTGRNFPRPTPAVLSGYKKYETTQGYPVIFSEAGQTVSGVVYYSVTDDDWKRLDRFEDTDSNPPHYFRRLVTAIGAHGTIRAYIYVGNQMYFGNRLLRIE